MNDDPDLTALYREVCVAYADCSEDYFENSLKIRNLRFRARQAVDPKMAQEIMERACPYYNKFEAEFLGLFPDDCKIVLAREGSVCIYVQPGEKKLPTINSLHADEYDVMEQTTYGDKHHGLSEQKSNYGGYKNEVRIWWD